MKNAKNANGTIDERQALEHLHDFAKCMGIDFAYDEGDIYELIKDPFDEHGDPLVSKNGKLYDDRGPLFAAFRNLLCTIVPNTRFRNDHYILDWSEVAKSES